MMNENFVITKKMFEDLNYDEDIQQKPLNMNDLKNQSELIECLYELQDITRDETIILIKNYLNELSIIESEENCIPQYVVKNNIEFGLKLSHKITDFLHHLHNDNEKAIMTATSDISIFVIIRTIINAFESKWNQINVIYDAARKVFITYIMENVFNAKLLKKNIVDDLTMIHHQNKKSFCSMFILKLSDHDAAIHNLNESFDDITSPWQIGYIYIQESCYDEFLIKLKSKLKSYPIDVSRDIAFWNDYNDILMNVNKLKIPRIENDNNVEDKKNHLNPIICNEFDRRNFIRNGSKFSPIIIIRKFRTVKEVISLARNDGANSATIWSGNYSAAYEIATNLNLSVIWINCLGIIDLGVPIKIVDLSKVDGHTAYKNIYGKSGVQIKNSYHFEYFLCNEDEKKNEVEANNEEYYKTIIFPIGVTFSN